VARPETQSVICTLAKSIATQHGSPRIPRGCLKFGKSGWDSYAKVPSTQRFQSIPPGVEMGPAGLTNRIGISIRLSHVKLLILFTLIRHVAIMAHKLSA
jgi:hypothetical protein